MENLGSQRALKRVSMAFFGLGWALARVSITPTWAMPDKAPPATVFVSPIKAAELYDLLAYPARVVPKINSIVIAESDGVVTRILAPLGHKVIRGQRLLTITHTDPVYQYAPVQVLAPASGVVSLIEVTEGTQVSKGQRLGSITNPEQVKITIEVPAQDLLSLRREMKGEFNQAGRVDPIQVKMKGLSAFVDPATGTAAGELEIIRIQGSSSQLPPGLVGQVSFRAQIRQGISVPDHAIFYKGSDPFVRIVDAGKAKQMAVKLGRRQRGFVEVLSGLKDGDSLVERTSRYVADGEEVTAQGASK